MNLYLISQDENNDYDTFDSAVVCCETEEEARIMPPSGDAVAVYGWCNAKDVKVELIGFAVDGVKKGVVCASFNAG
jgi:hypothetical protein